MRTLLDNKLLKLEHRDTIIAEKLLNPVVINDIRNNGHTGVYKEEEFLDAFLDADKAEGKFNKEK